MSGTTHIQPAPRRYRLAGGSRRTILTLHIVAAVGFFAASFVLLIGGLYAATRDDATGAHAIYSFLQLLMLGVSIPFAASAALAGVVLAETSKWRLLSYWWVMAKIGLQLATVAVGVAFVLPRLRSLLHLTELAPPSASGTRWTLVGLAGLQTTMLLAAATLAVFKPGRARGQP